MVKPDERKPEELVPVFMKLPPGLIYLADIAGARAHKSRQQIVAEALDAFELIEAERQLLQTAAKTKRAS